MTRWGILCVKTEKPGLDWVTTSDQGEQIPVFYRTRKTAETVAQAMACDGAVYLVTEVAIVIGLHSERKTDE